jgi:hypothetical protein
MGTPLESPAALRQLRLHGAALWQAGVALLCTGLAIVVHTWSLPLGLGEGAWQGLAVAFYLAHAFNIYRLAVAEGFGRSRAALWLVLFAPLASLMALALLKPVLGTARPA